MACQRPKCSVVPNGIAIFLVDTNSNNLIGTKYSKDSIKLFVSNTTISTLNYDSFFSFLYSGCDKYNDLNYFLYLSKSDIDTINLKIAKNNTDCGIEYHCIEFKYNSKIMTAEPNSYLAYKIVKK
jgi:hypothetical protein